MGPQFLVLLFPDIYLYGHSLCFLIGVITLLLIENKKQRDTILKLNLEMIDLKYKSKQDLVPRKNTMIVLITDFGTVKEVKCGKS